jgi:predicted GNAT family N-acyltransferase
MRNSLDYQIIKSSKITPDIVNLRRDVFVIEQEVDSRYEFTGDDHEYAHLALYINDDIIGTLRYKIADETAKIGRVAIKKSFRNKGFGLIIMKKAIKEIKFLGVKTIILGAQLTAQQFYSKLGFVSSGEVFMYADIEHIMMEKKI